MTNYVKQFDAAKKSDNVENMTYPAFEFKAAGDLVIGELVDIQDIHFESTNSNVNKYLLKTDQGSRSVIVGAIGDGQLSGRVTAGDIIRFEFVEKKGLTGGKTANIFNISRIQNEVNNGEKADYSADNN